MALSLEAAVKVRQRVKAHLSGSKPCIQAQVKALLDYLIQEKKLDNLQFVTYLGTDADAAGGADLGIDVACQIYCFYGKKPATDSEDAYMVLFDDATNDAGAGTDGRSSLAFLDANEEAIMFYPEGLTMAAGIVVKAYTDFDGTTDSTAGQAANGFLIIGGA